MSDLVIGVDPSSTCCGVAVFFRGTLRGWQCIKPATPKKASAVQRCFSISSELAASVERYVREYGTQPRVVIELPGIQGGRSGSGVMVTLGIGVGMVLKHLQVLGFETHMVEAQRWTRLGHSHCLQKEVRADMIRRAFPAYANEQGDKGLDAADAIGLGAWFLNLPLPKPVFATAKAPSRSQRKRKRRGS